MIATLQVMSAISAAEALAIGKPKKVDGNLTSGPENSIISAKTRNINRRW